MDLASLLGAFLGLSFAAGFVYGWLEPDEDEDDDDDEGGTLMPVLIFA